VSAEALKERLRADLKAAMQAKAANEVRLLRALIAALDNAEAVAVEQKGYVSRRFGDPSGEVPRLSLDGEAIARLLTSEIEARLAAAVDYDRLGEGAEATRLRAEADLVDRYTAG
jgi:uncharacterized protein YqeY